jgi:hypothetical protein
MVVGWQPKYAALALDDEGGGYPQRVVWLSSTDPAIPDVRPDWPGPLDLPTPATITAGTLIDVPAAVVDEVWQRDGARSRGTVSVNALDAHADLVRLKVAHGLADLDGRTGRIDLADWRLASMVMDTSRRVRALVLDQRRQAHADREAYAIARQARREAVLATSAEQRAREAGARAIGRRLHRDDVAEGDLLTRSTLGHAVAGKDRAVATLDDMLADVVAAGWGVEVDGRYGRGPSRPA